MEPMGVIFIILVMILIVAGVPSFVNAWSNARDGEHKFIICLMAFLVFVIVFGLFGGAGTAYKSIEYTQDFEYVKFSNGVSASVDNPVSGESEIENFKDAKTYNIISDSSYLKITISKNIYNGLTGTEYEVISSKPEDSQ